jgi:hypothetical protein
MIVDPDFLDHWKTRMLVDLLEDPQAPLYVIRIWGHCQMRRQWVFDNLSTSALKALCRYEGHANKLESAMVASGYLRRDDAGVLQVCEWEIYNASLVANWTNGKKGGRPQKSLEEKPMGNPWVSHGQPMANPWKTHGEPTPSNLSDLSSLSSGSAPVVCEPEPSPTFKREPFDLVFDEYPPDKRTSPGFARRYWVSKNLDQHVDAILAALRAAKKKPNWVSQYAPRLDNWLEGKPWQGVNDSKALDSIRDARESDALMVRQLPSDAVERIVAAVKAKHAKYANWPKSQFINTPPPEFVAMVKEGHHAA